MKSPDGEKQNCQRNDQCILVALGANIAGSWGEPAATLRKALQLLVGNGVSCIRISPAYTTKAYGQIRQPDYLNLVAQARCAHSPHSLLLLFKRLERSAGRRRLVGRNGARPLDIDLLDYKGRIVNWPPAHPRPKLVLPHPLMAERAFVLAPLNDIAPGWRHPVYSLTTRQLLARQGRLRGVVKEGSISGLDSDAVPCDLSAKCV